jgi:hypothetical protein
MAIYGIGANYGGDTDVSPQFIKRGVAYLGWDEQRAQPLHAILRHFKIGDIVYIKSHPPSVGLIIKAVGIVVSDEPKTHPKLGTGIPVKWLWTGEERLGQLDDKYPVRNITLYEEFNRKIQTRVLKLMLSRLQDDS